MRRNFCSLLAAAFMACCGASAMAQSAVGNAGFETAVLYDVPPAVGNWTAFFGGPATATLTGAVEATNPRTGAQALHLAIVGDANAFCGVQQPVTGITPGVSYTMNVWARKSGNVNNAVEFRFEWKNAAGGYIGDQFALTTRIDAALTDTYQQFTLTSVAPAGAASCALVLDVQTFVFNPLTPTFDTSVLFDDITFGATALATQNACCFTDGSCVVALTGGCPAGSTAQAASSTCSPNNCPTLTPGACCSGTSNTCTVTIQATCTALGGTYSGDTVACTVGLCQGGGTACRADFNQNNQVEVQDIFDFLAAWFAGCP